MTGRTALVLALALALVAAGCGGDDDGDAGDSSSADGETEVSRRAVNECDWPMFGHDVERSFSQPCDTEISTETAADLERRWTFTAGDVVTASPAVVEETVYVGDWAGTFYALDRADGSVRWTFETEVHPTVYSGQIVSSAAVADVEGERIVYFGGGKTLYALSAEDGELRWSHELGRPGDGEDPTEIESSPVVADGMVIVGWDVHNSSAGEPSGVLALDAVTGEERWVFDPEEGRPRGCGDVWSSPTVDLERRFVIFGTGNCVTSPEGWGPYTEAIVAVDLDTGEARWSYQPHEPNNDDFDFAGAPNLFEGPEGTALVGLGNKDAVYYAVDLATGEPVWERKVAEPGITRRGSNYSTGGFIGATAVADGVIVGGTAIGGDPFLHAIDAATGEIRWQQPEAGATYGSAAEANGVAFAGGTDFTLRALDLQTGEVLWSEEMPGAVSGGAAIVENDVIAVAGIREPGLEAPSETSGVTLFSLDGEPVPSSSTSSTTTATSETTEPSEDAVPQRCVNEFCDVAFDLIQPPPGTTPTWRLRVTLDPFLVEVETSGLGPPPAWIRPGSPAAETGATAYGVFMSERDDNPQGGLVCVIDESGRCTGDEVPREGATYNRITLLAVADTEELPSIVEGAARLVATISFDPPLTPVQG